MPITVLDESLFHHHVVQIQVVAQSGAQQPLVSHTVELAVLHMDVVDVVGVVQSVEQDAILALLAGHLLHVHVPHRGVESAAAHLLRVVVQVDAHHRLTAFAHLHFPHVDVLYHAATARVALDAQHAVQVGRVHLAVLHVHVAASARYFRAYHHAAVAVLHLAVAHDDVLAGDVPFPAVHVASALDGDAVVAGVEDAVFYQHPVARLRVAAVAVGSLVPYLHAAHGDVVAQQRVNHPEGRPEQRHALDEHALALV